MPDESACCQRDGRRRAHNASGGDESMCCRRDGRMQNRDEELSSLGNLKVPYHKKHVFSALYIYKLVLPEPANPLNEENKRVLHGLCSPPTGNTALLQAVQILLLSLHNERSHYHSRPPLCDDRRYQRGGPGGEVRCVQRRDSSVSQCCRSELDTQLLCCWL